MTPRQLILDIAAMLREREVPDPVTDSALLLSSLMGKSPLELRADFDTEVPADVEEQMRQLADMRMTRLPLQYILKEAPFCGKTFYVDEGVLIPRPETELLCYWALEFLPPTGSLNVLDLCTGIGCIGLTIKSERPETCVTLLDLSPEALKVAEINRKRLSLNVRIIKSDLFSALPENSLFDMILSNPPYIPSAAGIGLQQEVTFEPAMALFGGEDGLDFYRAIAENAPAHLTPGGILMMELGDGEAEHVRLLLQSYGWKGIEFKEDYADKLRIVKAVKQV